MSKTTSKTISQVSFLVYGHPLGKGSVRPFRGKRRDGSEFLGVKPHQPKLKLWQQAVADAAAEAMAGRDLLRCPVAVLTSFFFARPKGHYGTGKNRGRLKPSAPVHHGQGRKADLDKLVRAVFDGLTGIVFDDDGRVCRCVAVKAWTEKQEGALVRISAYLQC